MEQTTFLYGKSKRNELAVPPRRFPYSALRSARKFALIPLFYSALRFYGARVARKSFRFTRLGWKYFLHSGRACSTIFLKNSHEYVKQFLCHVMLLERPL